MKDKQEEKKITCNDIEWSDYVLGLLSDDEKINGNPTTDGLRRIFEIALKCTMIDSSTSVVQSPSPENEKRATVVHSISYILNDEASDGASFKQPRSTSGAADVYWGNCDKIYRNHPVAVAETRAEGRALRRALKLRKVVAAEEIASNIEDDVTGDSINKISSNQMNFIDVMAKRLNIDVLSLGAQLSLPIKDIYSLTHENAVCIIRELSKYQQNMDSITPEIKPYQENWK